MICLSPERIARDASALILCADAPISAMEATTPPSAGGKALAATAMATGLGGVDYAAEDTKWGPALSISAQTSVAVGTSGRASHVALVDIAADPPRILLVHALGDPVDVLETEPASLPALTVKMSNHR